MPLAIFKIIQDQYCKKILTVLISVKIYIYYDSRFKYLLYIKNFLIFFRVGNEKKSYISK